MSEEVGPVEVPVEEKVVVEEVPQPEVQTDLSVHDVALEAIAGHWGRGQVRRRRLEAAGFNFDEVIDEVNKILNQ